MNIMNNLCLLCKSQLSEKHYNRTRENDNHYINKCLECGHIQLYPIDYEPQEYYDKDMQDKMGFNIANREKGDFYEMLLSQSKRRVAYLVENKISEILRQRGIEVEPKKLPEFIDVKIKEKIKGAEQASLIPL